MLIGQCLELLGTRKISRYSKDKLFPDVMNSLNLMIFHKEHREKNQNQELHAFTFLAPSKKKRTPGGI